MQYNIHWENLESKGGNVGERILKLVLKKHDV
jgi:hypothetical protein